MREVFTSASALGDKIFESTRDSRVERMVKRTCLYLFQKYESRTPI